MNVLKRKSVFCWLSTLSISALLAGCTNTGVSDFKGFTPQTTSQQDAKIPKNAVVLVPEFSISPNASDGIAARLRTAHQLIMKGVIDAGVKVVTEDSAPHSHELKCKTEMYFDALHYTTKYIELSLIQSDTGEVIVKTFLGDGPAGWEAQFNKAIAATVMAFTLGPEGHPTMVRNERSNSSRVTRPATSLSNAAAEKSGANARVESLAIGMDAQDVIRILGLPNYRSGKLTEQGRADIWVYSKDGLTARFDGAMASFGAGFRRGIEGGRGTDPNITITLRDGRVVSVEGL